MNYKCTNVECGWEGTEYIPFRAINADEELIIGSHCPKCYSIAVENMWTKEKPTEPGYYWYRYNSYCKPEIYQLFIKLSVLYAAINFYPDAMEVSGLGGEWSERIEPPK